MTELTSSSSGPGHAPGTVLAGRYRLARRLASGGMAEVWEATDSVLNRPVAIKLMHPHLATDPSFLARFQREAVAVARLSHPGIVSIFDTFDETDTDAGGSGYAGIVMELVDGDTLRARLDERRHLQPDEVIDVGVRVAEAVEHAHQTGVVHRDIKPGNIMLCRDGRVLLTDFGIAKAAAEGGDLTREGTMIGTAKYLAPEQVEGNPVDARADVYALGAVLYEALCGRPPFQGDSDVATALARLRSDPLRPRQIRAGVPRELEAVVMHALARDPDARPQSASELRDALASCGPGTHDATTSLSIPTVDPTTVDARPTTSTGPAPSFSQSERRWMLSTVVIVLIGAALLVSGILFSRTDAGQRVLDAARDAVGNNEAASRLSLAAVRDFDPFGDDREEHRDRVQDAVDNDPSTAWNSETYRSPLEAIGKPGVGIYVRTQNLRQLDRLEVSSPSRGWTASVHVATFDGTVAEDLAAWGEPVDTIEGADGSVTFDLAGRSGNAVLLWFTTLGDDGGAGDGQSGLRASVTEMRLFGR